jgi:hypothetical protein
VANAVFDILARALEREAHFDRLAARGTLRLSLRAAGLDRDAGPAELAEVVARLLPGELACRGVERPEEVCEKLRRVALGLLDDGGDRSAPCDRPRKDQP